MAKQIINDKGKVITLENPAERAKRYANELHTGVGPNGQPLTPTQAALRMGVLKERQTQAKIYNKKHGRPNKHKNKKKVGTQ